MFRCNSFDISQDFEYKVESRIGIHTTVTIGDFNIKPIDH